MSALLETRGLTVRFGGVTAVNSADLRLEEGQIVGLIGPNGAGKTTLLGACTGFIPHATGQVVLAGEDILGSPPAQIARRGLVRTFQGTRPIETMTVFENVVAGAYRLGSSGAFGALFGTRRARADERAAREKAAALIEKVGLAETESAYPSQLSTGRRRLLEIARVLAAEPRVVLLDEPAAGLNRAETDRLANTLRALQREGLSSVLVEHDVDLVLSVSDTVVVLDQGEVIATGSPREVSRDPAVIDAYLGARADEELAHA